MVYNFEITATVFGFVVAEQLIRYCGISKKLDDFSINDV